MLALVRYVQLQTMKLDEMMKNTLKQTKRVACAFLLGGLLVPMSHASVKAGFAYDYGLGVTAQINSNLNLFVGNDGFTADYLFRQGHVDNVEGMPLNWYVGGGAFIGWKDDFGVRLPLGLNLNFAPGWNGYGQISPGINLDNRVKLGIDAAVGVRYSF
ncbi:hypothetical protein [Thaumasiovibrio sp. DFM-14]|uniref:hypothetical protein n=1 Tax=Thaumasiovibrio sp. DFM-14 TaxID=3384792 RepID=UPI0039A24D61